MKLTLNDRGLASRVYPPRGVASTERYSLIPPVYEEAKAVDSTGPDGIYVCEFNRKSVANEVGVGAGLSATDRVLTQSGGIPAAVDGWRQLGNGDTFTCTTNFLDDICHSTNGFTLAWKTKDWAYINNVADMGDRYGANGGWLAFGQAGYTNPHRFSGTFGASQGGYCYTAGTDVYPEEIGDLGEIYVVLSYDPINKGMLYGFSYGACPKTMADFDYLYFGSKFDFNVTVPYANMTWGVSTYVCGTGGDIDIKIGGFMAARKPCFVKN